MAALLLLSAVQRRDDFHPPHVGMIADIRQVPVLRSGQHPLRAYDWLADQCVLYTSSKTIRHKILCACSPIQSAPQTACEMQTHETLRLHVAKEYSSKTCHKQILFAKLFSNIAKLFSNIAFRARSNVLSHLPCQRRGRAESARGDASSRRLRSLQASRVAPASPKSHGWARREDNAKTSLASISEESWPLVLVQWFQFLNVNHR